MYFKDICLCVRNIHLFAVLHCSFVRNVHKTIRFSYLTHLFCKKNIREKCIHFLTSYKLINAWSMSVSYETKHTIIYLVMNVFHNVSYEIYTFSLLMSYSTHAQCGFRTNVHKGSSIRCPNMYFTSLTFLRDIYMFRFHIVNQRIAPMIP